MNQPNNPQFVVIDANVTIGLCANEPGKHAKIVAELQKYLTAGCTLYAPHVLVMETLYVLCNKAQAGTLTAAEHTIAIAEFQQFMLLAQPPPDGDASLIARAEQLRQGYGCSRSADGLYIALAEDLAKRGPTELLTFDVGQSAQAKALAPTISVNLLQA